LFIEYSEGFVDTKARDLDRFAEYGVKPSSDLRAKLIRTEEASLEVLERLALAFNDSDPLLSSQGNIPIYYWVLRKQPGTRKRLRSFLEQFTVEVRENLRLSRLDPNDADPELTAFYTMSRTTNDQASLLGRYKILSSRLRAYREAAVD